MNPEREAFLYRRLRQEADELEKHIGAQGPLRERAA
jgi:hypothetical protein